jgi:hypothetical protein
MEYVEKRIIVEDVNRSIDLLGCEQGYLRIEKHSGRGIPSESKLQVVTALRIASR